MRAQAAFLGVLLLLGSCQTFIVDCIEYDRSSPDVEYCLRCAADTQLSLDKRSCSGCTNGCLTCDPLDRKKCLSCPPSRFLNGTNCDYCTAGCQSCRSADVCLSCISNMYIDRFGGCSPCSLGCEKCESAYMCRECIAGFTLNGNICKMNSKIDNSTDTNKRAPVYPAPPSGPSGSAIFLYVFLGASGALLVFGIVVALITHCCSKSSSKDFKKTHSSSNNSVKTIYGDSSFLHNKIASDAAKRGSYVAAGVWYPDASQHSHLNFNPPVVVNTNNPFI